MFADGDLSALRQATVAIVGTRRATPYGIGVARRFGAELAQCGVCVLSGLALGIDAAAHQGALAAGAGGAAPVAVVGCGLDWPYPASNRALWRQVANVGVVLSEWPLGTRPEPWRFPARNRIVAALADVVVIVESHEEGGALITAELAEDRNRPILAVPGSIRSPASIGPHALLRSGSATLATATDDILAALPLRDEPNRPQPTSCFDAAMPNPNAVRTEHALVLNAVGWEPTTFESVAGRVHLSLGDIAHAIEDLLRAGTLSDEGGMFVRRAGPLSPPS